MVRRVRIAVVLCLFGLTLGAPAAAHAVPPVCQGGALQTPTNAPINLPGPQCTGMLPGATVAIVPQSGPANGTITQGSPNVYTPNTGFQGFDSFRYTVTNPAETESSNEATVSILVDAAPTCANGAATVAMNGKVVLDALPCSDPDGVQDYFIWSTDGDFGRIDFLDDRVVTYTPNPGFAGTDTFVISAEDRFGLESQDATMTITVVAPLAATPISTPVPTPAATPTPKDTSAPSVTLTAKKATFSKGIPLTLGVNENASATLTVSLDQKSARKYKLSRTVGTLKSAVRSGNTSITLKLSAKARKAFKTLKQMKVTVTAVVTDTAGNKTTKTLKVTIKK